MMAAIQAKQPTLRTKINAALGGDGGVDEDLKGKKSPSGAHGDEVPLSCDGSALENGCLRSFISPENVDGIKRRRAYEEGRQYRTES